MKCFIVFYMAQTKSGVTYGNNMVKAETFVNQSSYIIEMKRLFPNFDIVIIFNIMEVTEEEGAIWTSKE